MQPYSCTYNIESLQSDVAICRTLILFFRSHHWEQQYILNGRLAGE